MASYQIITDSGADLPPELLRQLQVVQVPLNLLFRNQTLEDSVNENIKDLYAALRAGETASTSAINPARWGEAMEPVLEKGQDILVLAFSSGLSTTYQSAVISSLDLMEKYPGRQINVVDTRCASLGQGFLVWHACRMQSLGLDLESLTNWACEKSPLSLVHRG